MATGDIINVANNADGWSVTITIEGFGTGYVSGNVTYDYGLGVNNDPTNATVKLNIDSTGFSATGSVIAPVFRTVCGTTTVRKPYPDEATLQETVVGDDLEVVVALSDFIYVNDVPVGGIAFTFLEGWATQGGTPTEAIEVSSSTNSSTLAYPKALGKWDNVHGTMSADRVTGDFDLCVLPVAGHGVAAVKIIINQASPAVEYSAFINVAEAVEFTVAGIFAFGHIGTVPIGTFTDGQPLVCNFEVYPKIGDASSIFKTSDYTTASDEAICRNESTVIYDTSALVFAVVSTTPSGTPVSSTTLATASADPFATWAAAKDATPAPDVIYFQAGAYEMTGAASTQRNTAEWVRAMPHPDTNKAAVTLAMPNAEEYRLQRASFENVNIAGPAASAGYGLRGGDVNNLRFKGCTWASNAFSAGMSFPVQFASLAVYVLDCDGDLCPGSWAMADANAVGKYSLEGCRFTATSNAAWTLVASMVGCHTDGGFSVLMKASNPAVADVDGFIIAYNKFMDFPLGASNPGHGSLYMRGYSQSIGSAVLNNILETRIIPADVFQWGDELNDSETWNNAIVTHNTFVGERFNGPYNNSGSTPGLVTNMFCKANIIDNRNFKADTWTGDSGGNGARVGTWSAIYGVGFENDVHREQATSAVLRPEFAGLNTAFPASQYLFVDDATGITGGSGLGNGDYHLIEGDDAIGLMDEVLLPFDIEGTARFIDSSINGGAAGAYEFGTDTPPSTGFGLRPRYGGGSHRPRYNGQGRY